MANATIDVSEYLTTNEVAGLLRIKERKVYDLAASGELPCNKAIGKLLFPRDQIDAWLANHAEHVIEPLSARPPVFLGSHDPLLEWALRESRSSLAMLFDGSHDGIQRFRAREGVAAGLHIPDAKIKNWNEHAVKQHCAQSSVVLVEWAKRQRGLIVSSQHADKVTALEDIVELKFVPRQAEAGAQILFDQLLNQSGIKQDALTLSETARSENDVAVAVSAGSADVGFGLACVAQTYKLHFVPLVQERFDILVDRKAYFDQPLQTLWQFCQSPQFIEKASTLAGYDIGNIGCVHFNSDAGAF